MLLTRNLNSHCDKRLFGGKEVQLVTVCDWLAAFPQISQYIPDRLLDRMQVEIGVVQVWYCLCVVAMTASHDYLTQVMLNYETKSNDLH